MPLKKQPYFSTYEIVLIAFLVGLGGVFQFLWAHFLFQLKILGPFTPLFGNLGFMIWGYVALYFIPKSGVPTTVKTLQAVIEVLLGNPVGPVAIAYGALEGFAVDLAFLFFRKRLSINMMIVGALLSQAINGPIDVYRDAVPLNFQALATYFLPGVSGTVFTGWMSALILSAFKKTGLKGKMEPAWN